MAMLKPANIHAKYFMISPTGTVAANIVYLKPSFRVFTSRYN